MTNLALSSVPTNIVTAEALGVYSLSLLYDLFGGTNYQEVPSSDLTPLVSAQQGRAGDGTERLIYRASFQMHPEWRTSTNKVWMDVLEYAEATVPARYLA
jgi:hypothetical protein